MNKAREMNIAIKVIYTAAIFLFVQVEIYAQTNEDIDGEVQDAEVLIEKERKIELKQEEKLYEFIKWEPKKDSFELKPVEFAAYEFNGPNATRKIEPASVVYQKRNKKYQHYGKAGFGNYASPLLDVSLSSNDKSNQMIGLNLKHESFGSGEVDGKNSGAADTELYVLGMMNLEKVKLTSALGYELEKNFYYGYPTGTIVNSSDIKHSNNFLTFNFEAQDNLKDDALDYRSGIKMLHYSDNFDAKENTFLIDFSGKYRANFNSDAEIIFSKYQDLGIDESRFYTRLNPYYRLELSALTLDLGLSLSFQNDDLPNMGNGKLFPYARMKYDLNSDYSLFAKLDGSYSFNSLYQFASEIGVLNQSVGIVNSERVYDLNGGILGSPIDQLTLKVSFGVQSISYLPILVNNVSDQSRIDIAYDLEESTVITIGGESRYKFDQQNELAFGIQYFNYSSDSYSQIYHRPSVELLLSGNHQVLDNLNAKWNFTYQGGIYGQNLALSDSNVKLDNIPKLDLALHYQLKEQWGVFLMGENLLNKKYSRYLNYVQRGIQIRAGVTFRL